MRLRDFLNNIVQKAVSDDALIELWRSVNNEIYFLSGDDLRTMLKATRDRLGWRE